MFLRYEWLPDLEYPWYLILTKSVQRGAIHKDQNMNYGILPGT